MPPPEQKPSNEPALPKPTGPSVASRRWPTSPALPEMPSCNRPFTISPPPMPVPIVRQTIVSEPRPAPSRDLGKRRARRFHAKRALSAADIETDQLPDVHGTHQELRALVVPAAGGECQSETA